MLAIERRSDILNMLQLYPRVLVTELSKQYNVTEETIRRDLEKLEKDGLVKKTYGGAVLKESVNVDMPFHVREKANTEKKLIIAKKIEAFIDDSDTIIMDSSSTALSVAKLLKQKKKLTVITNSIEILLEFSSCRNIRVISTGGELRDSSLSLVGRNAERSISIFNVDKAVISCKGIDWDKGVTESTESEMEIKKAMISSARTSILAADSSKFNKVSFVKLMPVDRADLIVSDYFDKNWKKNLEEGNIKYL